MRKVLARKLTQLIFAGSSSVFQHDKSVRCFTPTFVRQADDRDFEGHENTVRGREGRATYHVQGGSSNENFLAWWVVFLLSVAARFARPLLHPEIPVDFLHRFACCEAQEHSDRLVL